MTADDDSDDDADDYKQEEADDHWQQDGQRDLVTITAVNHTNMLFLTVVVTTICYNTGSTVRGFRVYK